MPSDQMSEAGKWMDSDAAYGAAGGQAEEDSPAGRMRSEESFTLSPMA
jgi:hypothetical protein